MPTKKTLFALSMLLFFAAAQNAAAITTPRNTDNNRAATTTENIANKSQPDKQAARNQKNDIDRIEKLTAALNKLIERSNSLKQVGKDGITSAINELRAQIDFLNGMKTQLSSGTNASSTAEISKKSINDIRVFSFVIPRGYINAAVDRIFGLTEKLEGLSHKLTDRIAQAKAAGNNTAKLEEGIADMDAKIAAAKSRATAAKNAIAGLVANKDDKTVAQNNRESFLAARQSLALAQKDLKYARDAANVLAKEIRKLDIKVSAGLGNASSTAAVAAKTANATTTNATTTAN